MARKLMSFRLAPDLANFLTSQSEILGISVTELVNRLLRWAITNVPEGFFQTASLVTTSNSNALQDKFTSQESQPSTLTTLVEEKSPDIVDAPKVDVSRIEDMEKEIQKMREQIDQWTKKGKMIEPSNAS